MIRTCFLIVAATLAGSVAAQAPESLEERFQSMDTNRDGQVSAEEHTAAANAMFKQLDADLDGKISVDEMRLARQAMHEKATEEQARQAIAAMDKNGDGKVDAQEHLAAANVLFQHTDANHDGAVTLDEMKEAAGPQVN